MSESSGSDDEFDEIDVYSMDLYDRTAKVKDILAKIREHTTFVSFRSFAESGFALLKPKQIDAVLDVKVVNWDDFHTKVLESIVDNRGTNKTNASRNATAHMDACAKLKTSISRSNPPDFATESEYSLNEWRSVVYTVACLFISELESSATRAVDDLSTKIDSILATPFVPLNDVHAEVLYYIAGAALEAAKRKIANKRTSETLKRSLEMLLRQQSTSKKEAVAAGMPTRRVADREVVSLNYASNAFYDVVCKYESVYRAVLNDDSILMYGEGVLRSVSALLSRKDVGLQEILDESEVVEVSTFLLNYYSGLRGKDFVRKENAQVVRSGETHRATIGVKHEMAKERNEKERESKGESLDTMMRNQLVGLCRQYKLKVSGNKPELLGRIREHMQKMKEEEGRSDEVVAEKVEADEEVVDAATETQSFEEMYGVEDWEQEGEEDYVHE